jgi:hypothetical protein
MAPSAESKDGGVCVEDVIAEENHHNVQCTLSTPKRNVAFAVNYELSMVDQFTASERKRRRGSSAWDVDRVPTPTGDPISTPPASPRKPDVDTTAKEERGDNRRVVMQLPLEETSNKRRSVRDKKKETTMSRSRVRYDMQLVPTVERNRAFLESYQLWWLQNRRDDAGNCEPDAVSTEGPRRSSRLTTRTSTNEPDVVATSSVSEALVVAPSSAPSVSGRPFADSETVLWIPAKRSDWEDSVSEMTAVCTSAALRRYLRTNCSSSAAPSSSGPSQATKNLAFYPPLSRDYIRDRVDIDDPLHGFQLRHRTGGWLQGFVLWTTFTTWTHDFEWNSLHPMSGIAAPSSSPDACPSECGGGNGDGDAASKVDADGTLAAELQAQARSGNPHENGIVFDTIAEIGLVGGLGCGEYLLRMTLDSIAASPHGYRYVVLQATDQSKAFYERFGFVRVGAVCRYGLSNAAAGREKGGAQAPAANPPEQPVAPAELQEDPLEGYRHWTHPNESKKSLLKHGGPSYMMCLKLPSADGVGASLSLSRSSFLEGMRTVVVQTKPTIEQLGGSFTPGPKIVRRNSSAVDSVSAFIGSSSKKGVGRRSSGVVHAATKRKGLSLAKPSNASVGSDPSEEPKMKRRRMDNPIPDMVFSRLPIGCASGSNRATARRPSKSQSESSSELSPAPVLARTSQSKKSSSKPKKVPSEKRISQSGCLGKSDESDNLRQAFYSVRGPDGRFVTLPSPPAGSVSLAASKRSTPTSASPSADWKSSKTAATRIDKTDLFKQKVKSYPRSRVHYYNRVVKPKDKASKSTSSPTYYFVLNYNETDNTLCLVPMAATGSLTGRHQGRPRYQAVVGDTSANFLRNVAADQYEVVPATMIMKTPVVASEAWDVVDK